MSSVNLYVDGQLVGSATTAPFVISWDSTKFANGQHTMTAKSYDANGNVNGMLSVTIQVTN